MKSMLKQVDTKLNNMSLDFHQRVAEGVNTTEGVNKTSFDYHQRDTVGVDIFIRETL